MSIRLGSSLGTGSWADGNVLTGTDLNDTFDYVSRLAGSRIELIGFNGTMDKVAGDGSGADTKAFANKAITVGSAYTGVLAIAQFSAVRGSNDNLSCIITLDPLIYSNAIL